MSRFSSEVRTRRRADAIIFALVVLLAAPLLAQAPRRSSRFSFEQRPLQRGGEVKVRADEQELIRGGVSTLSGNVVIEYQDIKIQADKVTYDDRTRDISAEGHVILDQGPQRLSAEKATYNLETRTGVLSNAKAAFEPSIFFAGEKIEKIDEDTYILTRGVLTSCDITDPDWSFRLGRAVIDVDGYARLRNVAFFADRVPAFWLPWLIWPTKRDRALGLLVPRVGSNQEFGEYIENSLFIPIGQSMDLTLRGDFWSEGARRGGGIFRYVPTPEARGDFEGYAVLDPDRDKVEWKYEYTHTQEELPGGFRAVIDVRDFSNLDFFKTFEREFEIRTLSSIYSSGYLTKNRPGYSLNIKADRRENLIAFQQSVVFEQLPTVQYTIYPTRIGTTPLYYSLESSTSQLRRKERRLNVLTANEYLRGDLFPTVSMQLRTPPWISVKPQISLRETWYSSRIQETTREIEDEPLSRFYGQGEVEFSGPSISRIYDRSLGDFSRFKHVIEPRARYLYTSDVEEQNQVIQFDTVDSPLLPLVGQQVEYSLTNRLIGKQKAEGSSAREIMSVTLRQSVSLDEPFSVSARTGEEFFLTPLSLNVRVNPYQSVTFDSTASFGVESEQLDTLNMSANLRSKSRYLNFTWFAAFLKPGQTTGKTSQFRVGVGSPVWRDRLRLDVGVNYDAERQEFQERRYASSFTASCWGITVERREYLDIGLLGSLTHDHIITLDLKNVGPLRGSF